MCTTTYVLMYVCMCLSCTSHYTTIRSSQLLLLLKLLFSLCSAKISSTVLALLLPRLVERVEETGGRPPLLNDSDDNTDGDSPLFLSLLLRTLLPPPKLPPKPPF